MASKELRVQTYDSKPEHPIRTPYCLWFSQKSKDRSAEYEAHIKMIGEFHTVEDFWRCYTHVAKPMDLPQQSDYHLFRKGIKPMWEDPENREGGKWVVRLNKGFSSRLWEELLLAVLADQFDVGDEICGVVVSIRFQEDIISVWNKNCRNQDVTAKIKETIKRIMNLPSNVPIDYKDHNVSLLTHSVRQEPAPSGS